MAYWDYFEVEGVGLQGGASASVIARSGNQIKVHIDYWMGYYYSGNSSFLSWQGWNQYSGATTIHEGGYAHSGSASASDEIWVTVGYGSGSINLLPSIGADWDFAYNQDLVLSYSSNYLAPNAPTIGSATKVSDTKARIGFTGNTTDQKPYSKIQILRSTDGGSYVQIAEVSWSSQTSYEDTTITADHRYSYKVTAKNSAGTSSESSASNTIYTTPDAPSGLKAVYNTGSSSVTARWTNNATNVSYYQIQAADNGSFTGASTYTSSAATYTDSNPPMGTAWYRVRAVDSAGNASAWTSGVKVTTLCAPAAPTITTPSQGSVFAMPSSVAIGWSHNALDGTAQSSAVVAISTNGGSTWTEYTVSGATSSYTLNTSGMSRDTVIQAKVKTKGTYASYGPFCTAVSFSLREAPSVAITYPATDTSEVTNYPINTSWSTVCRSGSIVETVWELDGITHSIGTSSSYSLTASERLLMNKKEYVLRVTVRSSYGLTATAERRFKTDYTEPAPPQISIAYDKENGAATIVLHSNNCCMRECDGSEVAGALCSITFEGVTRYFIMPDVSAGDVLWLSGNDAALFLNRSGTGRYDTDVEVEYDVFTSTYIGNTLMISELIASFDGDQLVIDSDAASFADERLDMTAATAIAFTTMPAPDHYILYRITDDGEELISDSMAAGGSVVDRVPPLNAQYRYKACSVAVSGSASFSERAAYMEDPDGWFFWNYGTAFDDVARIRLDPDDGETLQNNSESVLFEGDDFPTAFGGSANIGDLSVSGAVHGNDARVAFQRGLSGWKGKRSIYRTPYGDVTPVRVHQVSVRRSNVPTMWDVSVGQEHVL